MSALDFAGYYRLAYFIKLRSRLAAGWALLVSGTAKGGFSADRADKDLRRRQILAGLQGLGGLAV